MDVRDDPHQEPDRLRDDKRSERYLKAEVLKLMNMMMLKSLSVLAMKIIRSKVLVMSSFAQHMIDNGQDTMGKSDDRFLLPKFTSQTMKLRGQVIILRMGNRPGHLTKYRSQGRVSLARLATEPFAATLLIPRA